jgi:2-haloacid dehalogenase
MSSPNLVSSPSIVVFDLGKVLLEWDPRHLYRAIFEDEHEMERFLAEVTHPAWNLEQDRGRPWDVAIAEAIARAPHYEAEIIAYRERWLEMQPHAIEGTVAILEALDDAGTPLYAITNYAADTYRETAPRYEFFRRFRGVVVSGEERVIKPDRAIFDLFASRYGVDLPDCVFIDDSAKNVAGAKAAGMHALLFESPERLRADLGRLGFPV